MSNHVAPTPVPAPATEPRFAAPGREPASGLRGPRRNGLIAALDADNRLLPDLEPVALPLGWTVHDARDPLRHVYFPTSGIVSTFHEGESGAAVEVATTGREGVVGVPVFPGGAGLGCRAVVVGEGDGFRLRVDRLQHHVWHDERLASLLAAYAQALMTQVVQGAVCNRLHSVDQQLCRKILWSLDALGCDDIAITHDLLGRMLGVRRESITQAAGRLHALGLIDPGRGHIAVLDREALEARACECYAVVRRAYARLLPAPVDECVVRPAG